jgi:hypothetical protein
VSSITYVETRRLIENVKDTPIKMFLKALYLLSASPDEMAGKLCSGTDAYRTDPYGPKGTDVTTTTITPEQPEFIVNDVINLLNQIKKKEFKAEEFVDTASKIPIAIFTVRKAKQNTNRYAYRARSKEATRKVALPLLDIYEPWTRQLYEYFVAKKDEYVFPFNRQTAWHYVTKYDVFRGKTLRIRIYKSYNLEDDLVPEHPRAFKLNGLRSLRNEELLEKYNFDWADLETYTGMQIRHQTRVPVQIEKFRERPDWRTYINMLCTQGRIAE